MNLYVIGAVVIAIAVAAWRIDAAAFKRGENAAELKTVRIIAEQKKAVIADVETHRAMTPDQLDEEFRKNCLAQGGTEEQCK